MYEAQKHVEVSELLKQKSRIEIEAALFQALLILSIQEHWSVLSIEELFDKLMKGAK